MNEQKVCFICCTNNLVYEQECRRHLEYLLIPEGMQLEVNMIHEAQFMTAAYNEGMQYSDAKYKVYLHQDVFIWNQYFIFDMLEVFENKDIGMFGVLGGNNIPDDGVLYQSWNVGMTYACDTQDAGIKQGENPRPGTYQEVEVIDGMIMATQYDIFWREDLFKGWDFYDISQSFEFRKRGYVVAVPYQKEPWCMHDCGRTKLQDYNQGRKILLQKYGIFFQNPVFKEEDFLYNKQLKGIYDKRKEQIIECVEQGDIKSAMRCCEQYDDTSIMDTDLSLLKKLVSVCETEYQLYGRYQTWSRGENYSFIKNKYHQVKFLLWDAEFKRDDGKKRLKEAVEQNIYSVPLLVVVAIHNVFHFEELFPVMLEGVKAKNSLTDLKYLQFIIGQITSSDSSFWENMYQEICEEILKYKVEEKIAELEQRWQRLVKVHKAELPKYYRQINSLLKEGDKENLSIMLSSEEFCSKFETVTDMAYMVLVNQIYQEELKEHATRTILDGFDSIEGILAFIQEIKFRLWRVEFDMEDDAGEQFMKLVDRYQMSNCLLKYMVHVAGMDKVKLLLKLSIMFLDRNMISKAFALLKYADELSPGTEEILCTMANLCLQVGKKSEALYCLQQVNEPTKLTETFRKLCET